MAPKKKGKGKGDKLSRMTIEQRQQYLDKRAAQEAETNRRKEELLAGFLKLKLKDERQKGNVNEAKLMTKWREILREAKTSSLTNQLKELKEAVRETTARQDTLIQLLANQVGQAQHQSTQAAHTHLAAVHRLTELHEEHIGALTHFVRESEAGMVGQSGGATEALATTHLNHIRRHALITAAATRHHTLTEKEELAAFHTTITQITTQLEEEVTAARVEREGLLEEAWGRLGAGVKEHHSRTASLRHACDNLTRKVATNQANLSAITNASKDMQSEVDELRRRVQAAKDDGVVGSEVVKLRSAVSVLRDAVAAQRVTGRTLLKAINNRGDQAKQRLEDVIKEGIAVLELANICGRLETTRDRNLPFLPTTTTTTATTTLPPITQPQPCTATSISVQPADPLVKMSLVNSETDEGIGTSIQSSFPVSFPPSSASSRAPSQGSKCENRDVNTKDRLGKEKLARISELLNHENEAHEAGHTNTHLLSDYVMQEADAALRIHDDLRNFYRKYHHAQLDLLGMRGEHDALREEGRHLRGLLRQYFVTLGVSNAALNSQKNGLVNVTNMPVRPHPNGLQTRQRMRSQSVPSSAQSRISRENGNGENGVPRSAPPTYNLLWPKPQRNTHMVQEAHLLIRSISKHHISIGNPLNHGF